MICKVIETDYGAVEYFEAGTGEPVLYFHGTGITADGMLPFESRLVDDGFRLILPNRPGYGMTPLAQNRSAGDCANLAAALLDSLGISRASVMGSSGGGAFATSFVSNHARCAKSLVLLCPQLHRWNDKRWLPASSRWTLPFLKRSLLRRSLLKLYRIQLPRMSAARFLKTEAGPRYSEFVDDPDVKILCDASLAAMARGIQFPGFENDFVVFIDEDILDASGTIEVPTLVIYDEHDPIASVDHVDWFESKVPQCRRVPVHTVGHLIWAGPDSELMHETRVAFLKQHA